MIQKCRKQVERKEGYELQLVMTIVMSCQWDSATLVLKTQQPVLFYQQIEDHYAVPIGTWGETSLYKLKC